MPFCCYCGTDIFEVKFLYPLKRYNCPLKKLDEIYSLLGEQKSIPGHSTFSPFLFPSFFFSENMKVKTQPYSAQWMLTVFCCNSRPRPIEFTSQGPYVRVDGGRNIHQRGTMNYLFHFCFRAPQDASRWSCVSRRAICLVPLSEAMGPVRA